MKTAVIPNETRQNAGICPVSAFPTNSPEQSRTDQYDRDKVRRKVRRTFRIDMGGMNVTVHPGDDLERVRVIESATPPRYFIDDVEVDEATFYREHGREPNR